MKYKFISILLLFILFKTSYSQTVDATGKISPIKKKSMVFTLPIASYKYYSGELYQNMHGDPNKEFQFSLGFYDVGIQYFVINGFAIGGSGSFKNSGQGEFKETSVAMGPMASYYLQICCSIIPFASTGFNYTLTESEFQTTSENNTQTNISYFGKIGVVYMTSDKIGIYSEIFYSHNTAKQNNNKSIEGNQIGGIFGVKIFYF
ncbi:MAG: hypothetical protein PF637_01710 [Spirochaetes bacterium]|jgi:hypothetical protein|nr:hypothetical protein [Spirochaetota bacterium]